MFSGFTVVDFHTHPFMTPEQNVCCYPECYSMSAADTRERLTALGYSAICGSVLSVKRTGADTRWKDVQALNDAALSLREQYGDFYVPGFHVHPAFVEESCREIRRMSREGVRLIGELVPYWHGWDDYADARLSAVLDVAEEHGMVVSIHTMNDDSMDAMVAAHPRLTVVAAHPGEKPTFDRHLKRMDRSKNYYLDISGTGLFRHGLLRHGIAAHGAERFLYGSDYPICNPAMFLGGVALDETLTREEKRLILAGNASRLLGLTSN